MYSNVVTNRQIEKLEAASGIKLVRTEPKQVCEWKQRLGEVKRDLTTEEQLFIRNETLLSMLDFNYWAPRYCYIDYDGSEGGGIGPLKLWDSQRVMMNIVARAEENASLAFNSNEPTDGVRVIDHKARQLGGTALARAMLVHRLTLHKDIRAMSASVDEDKIKELYDRDKIIYDNLPWWLKPSLDKKEGGYDVKAQHIHFEGLHSRILYQHSQQKTGMGVGRHWDIAHLTECSNWKSPEVDIELNFFPGLSQYWMTLCILESTALGRGNWWHDFTERVRKGKIPGWAYCFVPWYAEGKKYRRQPPKDWIPDPLSLEHAKRVYATSLEFVGKQVSLPWEQLYWYETTRKQYLEGNKLNHFLTSYASTPEESFQHTTQSGFSTQILEWADLHTKMGQPFELEVA